MSKRLFEVARELKVSSTELLERLPEMGITLKVKSHTDMITDAQAEQIEARWAARQAPRAQQQAVSSGVVRRRASASRSGGEASEEHAEAVEPSSEPVAAPIVAAEPEPSEAAARPTVRTRTRTVVTQTPAPEAPIAEAPAPAPVEVSAPPAAEPSPAPPRFATRRTRPPEEPAAPVAADPAPAPEPVVVEEAAPVADVATRRARFATVRTRDESAVPELIEAPAAAAPVAAGPAASESTQGDYKVSATEPSRSRFATVVTRASEPATASPVEAAAAARREADARAAMPPRAGAARVVGTIGREVLSGRLEPERRDLGAPGAARRPGQPTGAVPAADAKKGAGAKRVVQSRDLYDRSGANRARPGAPSALPTKGGKPGMRGMPVPAAAARTTAAEHKRVVRMEEAITVSDLAQQMAVKGGEIAMKLMFELGMKGVNINTTIDFDTATLIADIYGFKIEQVGFDINKYLPKFEDGDRDLKERPPVVTVMGHVDHGKTSLLDAIRKTTVASGEAGGITQHIGAYMVPFPSGNICFLDTPGHEAFTALRARGARATDIVVLVVAADDGVMPQTVEAISHAKAAGVPIIVAINKIDKQGANPERIKQALTEYELVSEAWGGSTIFVETSALTGLGIDDLLEMINLQADVLELKANPSRPAEGLVIESRLDIGRGPVATVLVQQGTLSQGDIVVIGQHYGRVRTMSDERNRRLTAALPSQPVELTGLSGVPTSGERFYVVRDERDAKTIAEHVAKQAKQQELAQSVAATGGLEGIQQFIREGKVKELKIIIKADVQGSVEALQASLTKLSTEAVRVRVVHSAVGGITENDVNLASASREDAAVVIIGFNVRPDQRAAAAADSNGIVILTHSIIYDIIDRVRQLMQGMLAPVFVEEAMGRAEVRATFSVPKVGTIAGCMVLDGHVERNAKCRVVRDSVVIYESTVASLRHFEKDVKEVKSGFECGMTVDRFNDVKVGDIVEVYKVKEVAATL